MRGIVNEELEATLRLQIYGPMLQREETAVIDSGYNGTLTVPSSIVNGLSLTQLAPRSVTLGDASRRVLDMYEVDILWDGQRKTVAALCVEGVPLIGTALLEGHKMEAEFVVGGQVRIVPLS